MIYLSGRLKPDQIGARSDVGLLISYRQRKKGTGGALSHSIKHCAAVPFGLDNGCFNVPDLDVDAFIKWLEQFLPYQQNCLFVTAPDVVGDPVATWERSREVLPRIRALGLPAALVAQDGIEDRHIEWHLFDALFIGGSTEWKLSEGAAALCYEARRRGKFVHFGRVNSMQRIILAKRFGADSADGTYMAFAPDKNYSDVTRWLDYLKGEPFLPIFQD